MRECTLSSAESATELIAESEGEIGGESTSEFVKWEPDSNWPIVDFEKSWITQN